jgi:hypothetical protein
VHFVRDRVSSAL